jgi:hypothetical protein
MTNASLRAKGSPYRISEISIAASIPPGVSFSIGRIDDVAEALEGELRTSAQLIEAGQESTTLVVALDGTTVGDVEAVAVAEALAVAEAAGTDALPPSSVARG